MRSLINTALIIMFDLDQNSNETVIYGIHSIHAALKHRPGDLRRIYVDQANKRRFGVILKLAKQKNIPVEEVKAAVLQRLSEDGLHQGIVAQCVPNERGHDIESFCQELSQLGRPPLVLVLDRLSDPGNLGACMRSAAAFAADGVIATSHHSAPLNALARKTAAGAAECLPFVSVGSLQHALDLLQKKLELQLIATSAEAGDGIEPPHNVDLHSTGVALILGGEHGGVRASVLARCDTAVYVPMSDQMDCLNVSAACAVLLYEIYRQRLEQAG